MRRYKPVPVLCSVCGTPIRPDEPYLWEGKDVRHAVNCQGVRP